MPEFLSSQLVIITIPDQEFGKLAIIKFHNGLVDNYEVLVINADGIGSRPAMIVSESQMSHATRQEIEEQVTSALAFTADRYFFFCKINESDPFYLAPSSCTEDDPPKCKIGDELFDVEEFVEIILPKQKEVMKDEKETIS